MTAVLVVDNYDSFTFNLVQYLAELGAIVTVQRNDAIDPKWVRARAPDGVLLGPGPGGPQDAGITLSLIEELSETIPMLGVCLGHQCIAHAFGGNIVRASRLMHGRTSPISHEQDGVFDGLPNPFVATRYHSLVVEPESLPDVLRVHAWCHDPEGRQEIMGLRHRTRPLEGVQFHPESFLTEHGKPLLKRWLAGLSASASR